MGRLKLSVDTYCNDSLYPRIIHSVAAILQSGNVVAPVDVLVGMGLLTVERLDDWRRGQVPYLEQAIDCNLTRLARLLRILRFHAHDLNLVPSVTAYMRSGRGPKERLRFTKTGDRKLEQVYATHFVWPGKGPCQLPAIRGLGDEGGAREPGEGARHLTKRNRRRPIAEKIVKKMKMYARGKVIDLQSVMAGRANAEALQKTVATREDLAGFHPAHAVYVYAQNQMSVMSEQLTTLDKMARFVKLLSKAEDEYLPGGPPMSPLTTSFFTCWAFFDACVGLAEETIGTTAMAVGAAFGMDEELVRIIGLMQQSRMGIYIHAGEEGDTAILRELVTDASCRAIVPSGYRGRRGELWYVRVLPPPLPGGTKHVVFTTPYVLLQPGLRDWERYFHRTLPDAPLRERIAAYERHMKYGPTRQYWTDFVFEAYVNHQTEAIFLTGLPDSPESRPHSTVNRR
jgi:hypothetical protein